MLLVAGYIVVVPLIHRDQGAIPPIDGPTTVTENLYLWSGSNPMGARP